MVNKVIQKRESFSSVGCCCWRFYGVHQRKIHTWLYTPWLTATKPFLFAV